MISAASAIRDTRTLIGIDSQNPGPLEGACAEWVGNRLTDLGLQPTLQPVTDGRSNIVATVSGSGTAPRLVLLAHMDTVPVGRGWTFPPFGAVIANDRIYGRGACDMKAGLAVAVNLLGWLAAEEVRPAGDVVLIATVDEEGPDMSGAHALVDSGNLRPDDQILALEPTGMRLRIAQMGLRWVTVTVSGRMAHAGRAHLGIDANHVLCRIVDDLKQAVDGLPYQDAILGRPKMTCGTIAGGEAVNVVPPLARAQIDLRLVPPMKPEDLTDLLRRRADEVVAAFPGAHYEINPLGAERPPVRAADDAPIVQALRRAYQACTDAVLPAGGNDGHEAYTDASMVAALTGTTSATVFGPGSTDHAHASDESVSIADVELMCRIMTQLLRGW
jgi:succinyl-diaminopimelate desuccinylase